MTTTPTACTHGPSAVSGERCGKPAVSSFAGRDGTIYAECEQHDTSHIFASAPAIEVGTVVEVLHIGLVKQGPVEELKGSMARIRVALGDGSSKLISRRVDDLLLPAAR